MEKVLKTPIKFADPINFFGATTLRLSLLEIELPQIYVRCLLLRKKCCLATVSMLLKFTMTLSLKMVKVMLYISVQIFFLYVIIMTFWRPS